MEESSEPKVVDNAGQICAPCKAALRHAPSIQLAELEMCEACRKVLTDIREAAANKGFSIGL